MSVFSGPAEHAANPPSTWTVVKRGPKLWALTTAGGVELDAATTKRAAEALRTDGFIARLYAKETRWYAGEAIPQWKPYTEVTP